MSNFTMTPEEEKALEEFANVVAGESAVVMSTLLDKKIEIAQQSTGAADSEALGSDFPEEIVVVDYAFAEGFDASNSFLFNKSLVAKLSDLMMMGDGTAEFNEDHIDAIQEGVNQMMGAAATALSGKLGKSVDFQPSAAKLATLADSGLALDDMTASIFELQVEGQSEGKLALITPYSVIKEAAVAMASAAPEGEELAAGVDADLDMEMTDLGASAEAAAETPAAEELAEAGAGEMVAGVAALAGVSDKEKERLELLMDIKLDLSIELGRTRMLLRDILELGPGSVIELDKMAGETVDLLINNKKLAEGEVVVVDENFGVRITHLISMQERIKMLQAG